MPVNDISSLRGGAPGAHHESWVVSTHAPRATGSSENWSSLAARIEAVPVRGTIRGMFVRQARAWLPGTESARYLPFANYSLREYMETLLKAAERRHPREKPTDALIQLGLDVYPVFASSLVGSTIFGIAVATNAFHHVVQLAPRAYPVTLTPGHINVVRCDAASALVELRDIWVFPEFFHAGIWLGAMKACGVHGAIEIVRRSPCDVDFQLRWGSDFN